MRLRTLSALLLAALLFAGAGCKSPYHSDQGALFGGLTGAGVGALVGHATGNTAAGAAIGAGVGAVTGAVVGDQLDQIEAKNQAEIEARLGRPVLAGSVTIEEVIAMTQAGVGEGVIINHIRNHGVVAPPSTGDLITLREQGVSNRVVQAMQQPAPVRVRREVVYEPRPYVVYGVGPRYYYHRHYCGW